MATGCYPSVSSARTATSVAGVTTAGRPPCRPRAAAASSLAAVPQRTEEVQDETAGGSGGVDGLRQGTEAHSPAGELVDELQQVAQGAGQAVQPPHDKLVTGAKALEDVVEGGAGGQRAKGGVGPDPVAAGRGEGVVLQSGGLGRWWRRGRSRAGGQARERAPLDGLRKHRRRVGQTPVVDTTFETVCREWRLLPCLVSQPVVCETAQAVSGAAWPTLQHTG